MASSTTRGPISMALVGMSGVMQDAHIPNLLDLGFEREPLFRIAGVCDRDAGLVDSVGAALRAAVFHSMETVCASPEVEAVLIATPPDTHLALFEQAVCAGKHVFIEKPLTFSIREAWRMAALARDAATVVRIGYMFRHHRDAILTKKRIDEGAIGEPRTCVNLVVPPSTPVWPRRFPTPPKQRGGWNEADPENEDQLGLDMWSDNSVHYLNLMQWWFGPVESVYATWRREGPMMMLRYASGVLATHVFSPIRLSERRDFTIIGTEGAIDVRLHYPMQRNTIGHYAETRRGDLARKEMEGDHSDMYRDELVAFGKAIVAGETGDPERSFEMGARDLMTVKAAHRSSKSGREERVGAAP